MLAFSPEVYFSLIAGYNRDIWPAQLIAFVLGLIVLAAVLRHFPKSDRIAAAILAIFWIWVGYVFHWQTFSGINFVAPVLAVLFLLQGLLLLWSGGIRGNVSFQFESGIVGWIALILILGGLVFHTLASVAVGHAWPGLAVFGTSPNPTLVFTLGVLLLGRPRVPWHLMMLPVLWGAVVSVGSWFLGIWDALPVALATAAAVVLTFVRNRG